MRHTKRRIYLKNINKTDCLKRNARGTHLYSRWAYKRGGGDLYRNNMFVGKWMGLYQGGLKPGGFNMGFYGNRFNSFQTELLTTIHLIALWFKYFFRYFSQNPQVYKVEALCGNHLKYCYGTLFSNICQMPHLWGRLLDTGRWIERKACIKIAISHGRLLDKRRLIDSERQFDQVSRRDSYIGRDCMYVET